MLLKVHKTRLFDTHPARRFAEQYNLSEDVWLEMWKRYKILDYTIKDLADYFHIKSGKQIKHRYVKRWLFLTEIFIIVKPAREKGANVIDTCIFGKLEMQVIEEITRHLKDGSTSKSGIMV